MSTLVEERATGLGGSDIASLFNVSYGCKLRLWRQKRGDAPDEPRDTVEMDLGTALEPYFADRYAAETGRHVWSVIGAFHHPDHHCLLVRVDRMQMGMSKRDPYCDKDGVLEIKAMGPRSFQSAKENGLPEDYVLQLQHGMLVTGASWGSFAIGDRAYGRLLHWDVEPNRQIQERILEEGPTFWQTVPDGPAPARLHPDDKRCQKCEYRRSCQGAALISIEQGAMTVDHSLSPLLREYMDRKALADEADALVEESKSQLKEALGDRTAVEVGDRRVSFKPQVSMRWDAEALAKAYDKVRGAGAPAVSFKKESVSRPLRVW